MKLHELKPVAGARTPRKRVGRGQASGTGKTSGRGQKGQNSRSGGGVRLGFEGGQTPLFQRIPKRGFTNFTRKEFTILNLDDLNKFNDGETITPKLLLDKKVVKKLRSGIKILGNGKLEKKLVVKANKFSKTAEDAITSAGGNIEVI